uniref:Uncharacterized protein n=1 Tax=Oryza punctata TaxID=4537 RepID=A0A0E0L061_ORYPU
MKWSSGQSLNGSAETTPQVRSAHHSRPANATASVYMAIRRGSGSGDGKPTSFSHFPKPPHVEGPAVAVLAEHGDGVAVRRAGVSGCGGAGEEAGVVAAAEHGLLGAVDVREAEQLAGDGVADETHEVWVVQVEAGDIANPRPSRKGAGDDLGDDGGRGVGVHVDDEDEAVAAQEPPHVEGPAVAVLPEHGDGVAVRWPVPGGGAGEEAGVAPEKGLLGAIDLAGDGVADEAREVLILRVEAVEVELAFPSRGSAGEGLGDDGERDVEVHVGEEEEAVAARGVDHRV